MTIKTRPINYAAYLFTFTVLFFYGSMVVWSQDSQADFPENAHERNYGGGWECDGSFREVDQSCVAIMAPENAYLTGRSYGQGWECSFGYRQEGRSHACSPIILPANAHLTDSTYGTG